MTQTSESEAKKVKELRGIGMRAVLLQVSIVALLVAVVPANAQNNNDTAASTGTTLLNPNDPLLKGSELTQSQKETYNGMGGPIPVRKDAWTWYWNEKAHLDIDPQDKARFYGDDKISQFFEYVTNSFIIPFWNGAMEYDFIRVALLLVVAGMLLGLGASFFLPKKPESK